MFESTGATIEPVKSHASCSHPMTDYTRRKCRQSSDLPQRGGMSNTDKRCNRCRRTLPLEDFRFRTTQEGARYPQSCCKWCEAARLRTRKRLMRALNATVTPDEHAHDASHAYATHGRV